MNDILDDFEQQRRGPSYPDLVVEMGMLVEDRSSHFTGAVVRWSAEGVTLQDRHDYVRHFGWKPGGFLIGGRPVTLVRPKAAATAGISGDGKGGTIVHESTAPGCGSKNAGVFGTIGSLPAKYMGLELL